MLEPALKQQLREIFSGLESTYTLQISASPHHPSWEELLELLEEVASASEKIECQVEQGNALEFALHKDGVETGIIFRGIPSGHEFSSLLLAILNLDGKGKNFPDETVCNRARALKGPIHLTTYVSLECVNCPDVVQALNVLATLHPDVTHEMVDGSLYRREVSSKKIQSVPAVCAGDKLIHVGRGSFGDLLTKLEAIYGIDETQLQTEEEHYDVLVAGGGPAGVSSAIYSARKGLRVAIIAGNIGGQLKDTVGIENLISIPQTTGTQLAKGLKEHLSHYPIDVFEEREIVETRLVDGQKHVKTSVGETLTAPALIIATGASWRKLNVPGEVEYIGRGVAFCPHCDGPFYKGRQVAIVGGGNSGVEAAIDLAGICSNVILFEYADHLKADSVLQEKINSLPNVQVVMNTQVVEMIGNGAKLTALRVKDLLTESEQSIEMDGVFIQIGLSPNSTPFSELVEITPSGEIETDAYGRTSTVGVYGAGDVTTVPYKQIMIAMGDGAKAALSAFEDKIRGKL